MFQDTLQFSMQLSCISSGVSFCDNLFVSPVLQTIALQFLLLLLMLHLGSHPLVLGLGRGFFFVCFLVGGVCVIFSLLSANWLWKLLGFFFP